MKLIGCKAFDLNGLDSTYGSGSQTRNVAFGVPLHRAYGSNTPGVQPEEPIHVQVRIRQYGDALPDIRRVRASSPNLGQLPVGATLDCYV